MENNFYHPYSNITSNDKALDSFEAALGKNHQESFPSLKEAKAQYEKDLILKAYNMYKNTYKVAKALQVDQSTISKKMKQYKNEDTV